MYQCILKKLSDVLFIYKGCIKVLATLLSHGAGEFENCQLCGHEQGLLDVVVQPATTVVLQSIAVRRTLTFIWDSASALRPGYKTRATFLNQN